MAREFPDTSKPNSRHLHPDRRKPVGGFLFYSPLYISGETDRHSAQDRAGISRLVNVLGRRTSLESNNDDVQQHAGAAHANRSVLIGR